MTEKDPLKLIEAIAEDLEPSLGRRFVSQVIGKHLCAIEALVADGYPAETIFDRILSLTQSSAPNVKKGALRQALYRARNSAHSDQESTEPNLPAEMPQASPPTGTPGTVVPKDGTAQTSRHKSPAADERRRKIKRRAAMMEPD
ncbi:hypothetical protein [Microvirga calopogonii]|uniref:hypothetical protein n=1 Tax=Microvirga calopogonii TaxID=2078013 RepID=UPI000E0D0284|nr:hypothetical protein [Microvirga calopogonii]